MQRRATQEIPRRTIVTTVAPLRAILVTGTVGVGKTSTLVAIGDLLAADGEPYALVDLDWLAWLRPDPASGTTVQDVLVENLRLVTETFRRAGVARLVLARAVRSAGEVDAIRDALAVTGLTVARLVAAPAVVEGRLRARDAGAELAEHLAEAAAFAADAELAGIGDVIIEVDELSIESVARAVLDAAWGPSSEASR
jgi:adenylylsulfate kinase